MVIFTFNVEYYHFKYKVVTSKIQENNSGSKEILNF